MPAPQHEFVASLLDRSAAAYANLAAQRLLGGHPEIAQRYGAQAQAQWRFNLTQRVNEFAAAVELETPALFAEGVRWSRETFVARNLPGEDLRASLDALREVLLTELPDDCTALIEATMTPATAPGTSSSTL